MIASGSGDPCPPPLGRRLRIGFLVWCVVFLVGLVLPAVAAAAAVPLPRAKVERAVLGALPYWHGRKAQIIGYLDLTKPFATTIPWALVVAREPKPPPPDLALSGNGSTLAVCFVKSLAPRCSEARGHADKQWSDMTNALDAIAVVFAGPGRTRPRLMLKTCSAHGLNGSCDMRTVLFAYERKAEKFRRVFAGDTGGSNNNQAVRFIERGPLQGDMIVDYPTGHAPYAYWIEVYAPGKSRQYVRILRYSSITRYGDGNPLAVADSEMPEILARLGLWKPGDALPVPARLPQSCGPLVLRRGEEWCSNSLAAAHRD